MDRKVIDDLRAEFPDKNIVLLPEDDPKEVVVEMWRDDYESYAIAVIDRSKPHVHRESFEAYEVEKGTLVVHVDGEEHRLKPGDPRLHIIPGQVHWAEGDATRVVVHSHPPWSQDDHILAAD
jgi:mannose-6-phosphate isomerase-like protein (cupin superfamily)